MAKSYCGEVEFSAEDASRSDPDFLCQVFGEAIKAGAGILNIPDTVGYALPEEFGRLVAYVKTRTAGIENAILSVHCHNDLGLGVANSLAAALAGADQIECTINGIGERAGNASLEEIVMAIRTRGEALGLDCGIQSSQIYAASRLVSKVCGVRVSPTKRWWAKTPSLRGGIHQHGVLAMGYLRDHDPESVGFPAIAWCWEHSGRQLSRRGSNL
jgi:2-isopropylmalate synthase